MTPAELPRLRVSVLVLIGLGPDLRHVSSHAGGVCRPWRQRWGLGGVGSAYVGVGMGGIEIE